MSADLLLFPECLLICCCQLNFCWFSGVRWMSADLLLSTESLLIYWCPLSVRCLLIGCRLLSFFLGEASVGSASFQFAVVVDQAAVSGFLLMCLLRLPFSKPGLSPAKAGLWVGVRRDTMRGRWIWGMRQHRFCVFILLSQNNGVVEWTVAINGATEGLGVAQPLVGGVKPPFEVVRLHTWLPYWSPWHLYSVWRSASVWGVSSCIFFGIETKQP